MVIGDWCTIYYIYLHHHHFINCKYGIR